MYPSSFLYFLLTACKCVYLPAHKDHQEAGHLFYSGILILTSPTALNNCLTGVCVNSIAVHFYFSLHSEITLNLHHCDTVRVIIAVDICLTLIDNV